MAHGIIINALVMLRPINSSFNITAISVPNTSFTKTVDVWQGTPFFIIIILAGLQTIPEELYEAAHMDGASGIKAFFSITLPLIRYQLFISTILGTILAINSFDLFFVLTKGGPGNITTNATLFDWNNAFKFYHLSYASAISYVILMFTDTATIKLFLSAMAILTFPAKRPIICTDTKFYSKKYKF